MVQIRLFLLFFLHSVVGQRSITVLIDKSIDRETVLPDYSTWNFFYDYLCSDESNIIDISVMTIFAWDNIKVVNFDVSAPKGKKKYREYIQYGKHEVPFHVEGFSENSDVLEAALLHSARDSFIYTYTYNVSGKINQRYLDSLKGVALSKNIQVTFLGLNYVTSNNEDGLARSSLAYATGGDVLPIDLNYISDYKRWIFHYIVEEVNTTRTFMFRQYFPITVVPIHYDFTTDSEIKDFSILLQGKEIELLSVADTHGGIVTSKRTLPVPMYGSVRGDIYVSAFDNLEPGKYSLIFTSSGNAMITIKGSSAFSFTPRFSSSRPKSIADTVAYPTADETFVSIEVMNQGENVILHYAEIKDSVTSRILQLGKTDVDNFYSTNEGVEFKNGELRLGVRGVIEKTGEHFSRFAPKAIMPAVWKDERVVTLVLGDDTTLTCPGESDSWIYLTLDQKISTDLKIHGDTLEIKNIQLGQAGFYNCVLYGKNIRSYQVLVQVPPSINSRGGNVTAVYGDKHLILPCEVSGYPEPTVTWVINGTINCDSNCVYDKNSLVLEKITFNSAGTYTCKASNALNNAAISYEVFVTSAPQAKAIVKIAIVKNTKSRINCKKPKGPEYTVKWYKDGNFITSNVYLVLQGIPQDEGVYSCVMNNGKVSKVYAVNVTLCASPTFVKNEDLLVPPNTVLRCDVLDKKFKVSWFRDGVSLPSRGTTLRATSTGNYVCIVSSPCGKTYRQFNVIKPGCILNVKTDIDIYKPFIREGKRQVFYSLYNTINNAVYVEEGWRARLQCKNYISNNRFNFSASLDVVCVKDTTFQVNGVYVDFKTLNCDAILTTELRKSRIKCGEKRSMKSVLFYLESGATALYEVCSNGNKPGYIRHTLYKAHAGSLSHLFRGAAESRYSCDKDDSLSPYAVNPGADDACCFKSKRLLDPQDMIPGQPVVSTLNPINTIPTWSSCGSINWDDLGRQTRELTRYTYAEEMLHDWVGVIYPQNIDKRIMNNLAGNRIIDSTNRSAPWFLWKVVQNIRKKSAVAFLHVIAPGVKTESEAKAFVLCQNICDEIKWINNESWKDPQRGYIYCCSVREFHAVFSYVALINGATTVYTDLFSKN
ncbi:unnamed protein product [Leptosia nina]|uniref:Ig-like domain-containing protein n=1 Tax=Leptosia nina TaxID=320188 RepID=A0AAV1IZE3_9NEOP